MNSMRLSLEKFSRSPKAQGLFILLISAASLTFALISQYGFGLQPCVLCKWQRLPFIITAALGTFAFFLPSRKMSVVIMLSALVFFIGAGIAAFHVGVEQKWWEGTSSCGSPLPLGVSIEELERIIMAAPVVRCDQISFEFLGISMAGYNFLLSLVLGFIFLFSGISLLRGRI